MKTVRTLGRIIMPASLLFLAACQSVPTDNTTAATSQTPGVSTPQPETGTQAQSQGAPVAVFLADTKNQAGWTPVSLQTGTLYVNPQPVLTRADLTGIQAGSNKTGEGLLALELNDAGKRKVADITTKNPNMRLALVVGRTMMAAPGYTTPVTSGQLVFAVGTEQNATAAARAIAGQPDNGTGSTGSTGNTPTPAAGSSGASGSGTTNTQ